MTSDLATIVVVGTGIAGTAATALMANFLNLGRERRLRREERQQVAAEGTRKARRESLIQLQGLLDAWRDSFRIEGSNTRDLGRKVSDLDGQFALWLSYEDAAAAGLIYTVLLADDFDEAAARSAGWNEMVLNWYRGGLSGPDLRFAYD